MENKKGKFYGIGVGVGDTENITLKAINTLKKLDVVILPEAKKDDGSVAYEITKQYMKKDIEKIFIEFPMLKSLKEREKARKENAEIVKKLLDKGKNVAFLTIGDPMTYSTYTYVLEHIEEDTEVKTIAGINSFNSIAARLNIPLVIGDEDVKIISVNKKTDFYKEIENNTNLVLMKISRNFDKIKEAIIKTNNTKNIVIVSDCGKDTEKIYTNIEKIEKVQYFSTLILKKNGIEKFRKFIK